MYFSCTFVRRKISMFFKKIGLNHSKNSYNRIDSTKSSKTRKVPKGYIDLYVGEEMKRYEIPVKYLSLPAFQELIVQSQADELEPKIQGPIMLACRTEEFDQLLKLAKVSNGILKILEICSHACT
ncbi:auxin-induced protein 10a5 [Quercus suber]|uniref:Auxin-induced protein 10a5 n=1 Tax=Quercus suber TaxID=58331 RepID=A0AAW0K6K9_QUESU